MANALSLVLPLVFTFAIATWGPLSTRDREHPATDEFRGNFHRPARCKK